MKPRVTSVETVPSARRQRTPPPAPQTIDEAWPKDATGYRDDKEIGRYLPGQLGRFPTVGLDHGHINGTRPDQSRITKK